MPVALFACHFARSLRSASRRRLDRGRREATLRPAPDAPALRIDDDRPGPTTSLSPYRAGRYRARARGRREPFPSTDVPQNLRVRDPRAGSPAPGIVPDPGSFTARATACAGSARRFVWAKPRDLSAGTKDAVGVETAAVRSTAQTRRGTTSAWVSVDSSRHALRGRLGAARSRIVPFCGASG
jgi:hypothetical protein